MKNIRIFALSVLASLAFGLLLSTPIVIELTKENDQSIDNAMKLAADEIADEVLTRLNLYQYGLRGARGVITITEQEPSNRASFKKYSKTRDLENEFPGAWGFGFIRRVKETEEAEFLKAARLDGKPDFSIHQLTPHSGDRYIIQYVEPEDRNHLAIGLDIASEDNRRAAAQAAMKTGLTHLTAPITLVQASNKPQQSFLILMPIYKANKNLTTTQEREDAIFGWTYAPLRIQEILSNLKLDENESYLTLRDVTDHTKPEVFYSSQPASDALKIVGTIKLERYVFGRTWEIDFAINPLFVKHLNLTSPLLVFFISGMISLMIGIVMGGLIIQRQRENKIFATKAQLAAIVESSIDGIIGKDLHGVITSWNKGAENIFGYTTKEAIGKSLASLIVPADRLHEEVNILERISRGETVTHFNSIRQKKDGTPIPVSIAIVPIRDANGKIIGASKTVRDITEQKAAEDRILDLNLNLEIQVKQRTVQLELAKRNLQTILDAVPSMIGYWDKNLIIRVANHAYRDWFGLDAETIPGMSGKELLGEKLFEMNRPFMEAALRGEPQIFERSIPKPDGSGTRHSMAYYLPDIADGEVQGFHVIVHDITDITETNFRLEKALRENQALLDTIDKQLAYSVTNIHGKVIEVNENFCRLSGYSREQLIGQSHKMFESDAHPNEFWSDLWKTIASGHAWQGEICNRSQDGELRWFDTVVAPFIDNAGKIERYVALHADITERKRAEADRNRLSQLISNVLDAASEVAIIATDVEGTITIFNTGAELMLGYTSAEVVGKMTPAPFHLQEEIVNRGKELSENYNLAIEGFRVFVHTSELVGSETRTWTYVHKNGSHIQVSLAVTPMRDPQGNITGYLGIATDVTKELQHERELKSTIAQFAIATEVSELGVWSWDLINNVYEWNDRMYEIYSLPKDIKEKGVSPEHWRPRVHQDDVEEVVSSLINVIEHGGIYDTTFRVLNPNGKIHYVQARGQIERDKSGKAIKVTGVNRDVTIQHELIIWLQQAKENADAASAAKSSFLANMSHEIRTPMNAVLGMLQLVQQTELSVRQQDYIDKTQTAAKSLLGLLNDILDFSKIDAGKLQLDIYPFEMESLLRDIAVILSGGPQNKNLEVLYDIEPSLPKIVSGDRLRLQQILINLGGNAIKFTPEGQVIIGIKILSQTPTRCTLRISVSDTGIGISSQQISRIFEGFVQAEASTTRRFGGTGLGLVISKHLVNLMGSNLQVESEPEKGSRFWFDISLDIVTPERETNTQSDLVISDLKLLVVDDNPVTREILVRVLRNMGAKVDEAEDGYVAVEKTRNAQRNNMGYDAVLLDWRMPDLDGGSAATLIRQTRGKSKPPAIIFVTAFGRDEIMALQAEGEIPYAVLITKPVTPHQIIDALKRALDLKTDSTKTFLSSRREHLLGLSLLVVEDNALNRQVASELLEGEGATVYLAEGGLDGVDMVLNSKTRFDLIIMDVQMPDIDGMEATRRIRADVRFKKIPILAMTANASPADRKACLAAGMNDHIGKPIDIVEVVSRIHALVGQKNIITVKQTKFNSVHSEPETEVFSAILSRFAGKADLYERMLVSFKPDVTKLLEVLTEEAAQQNVKKIAAALHSIKGVSSTMGAKALASKAAELEKKFKSPDVSADEKILGSEDFNTLQQLLDRSILQLTDELNLHKSKAIETSKILPTLTTEEWKRKLEDVLPMLESGNMSAIITLEKLSASSKTKEQNKMEELLVQVNALDYVTAITTLKRLLLEI